MNEKTRKMIVFATLPAAIIWAVFNLSSDQEQPVAVQPAVQPTPRVPAVAPVTSNARLIDVGQLKSEPWGEDPFRTVGTATAGESEQPLPREWTLKGIVYTDEDPIAFVNRRPVRVGDVVNDGEVIAIDKKTVVIKYKNQEITLAVNKG